MTTNGWDPASFRWGCAGISVNMSAFAATFLAESAVDPRILLPYSHMGEAQELVQPHPHLSDTPHPSFIPESHTKTSRVSFAYTVIPLDLKFSHNRHTAVVKVIPPTDGGRCYPHAARQQCWQSPHSRDCNTAVARYCADCPAIGVSKKTRG